MLATDRASTWSPSRARRRPAGASWRAPPATVKKVFLELGGKSATIMLDDADLPSGARAASARVCAHAGQGCALTTRLLLPRSRYEEGVELATAVVRELRLRRPDESRASAGTAHQPAPARARPRLHRQGASRRARGWSTGGKVPAHLPTGYYVEPTIFADVDPDVDAGAGGSLRSRARHHSVRRRRRCGAHREQLDLRSLRRGHQRQRGARPRGGAPHPHGDAGDQRRHVVRRRHAVRRLPAERRRAGERRRSASRSTSRPK